MIKDSIEQTKLWLEKIVIDLSLCPFAAKVYYDNNIEFIPTDFTDIESSIHLLQKAITTILNPNTNFTTSLVIYESGLETFEHYLDVFYALEVTTLDPIMQHKIQFASFHPDYQFESTQHSDIENYTNRSPFPLIHILRTDDVTAAIESHPDINSVPFQNIEKMKKMGLEKIKALFLG